MSGEEDDEEIRVSECSLCTRCDMSAGNESVLRYEMTYHWGLGSMIYGLVGSIFWFVMRSSKATMDKILI